MFFFATLNLRLLFIQWMLIELEWPKLVFRARKWKFSTTRRKRVKTVFVLDFIRVSSPIERSKRPSPRCKKKQSKKYSSYWFGFFCFSYTFYFNCDEKITFSCQFSKVYLSVCVSKDDAFSLMTLSVKIEFHFVVKNCFVRHFFC